MFWIVHKCLISTTQKFIIHRTGYKSSMENLCIYMHICLCVIYKKQKKRIYWIGQATIPIIPSLIPVDYGNVRARLFLCIFPLGYFLIYPEVPYQFCRLRRNKKEYRNMECMGTKPVSWSCLLYQKNFY